jgi:hypothetical protein
MARPASAPTPVAAPTNGVVVEHGDLMRRVEYFTEATPLPNSGTYVQPSDKDVATMQEAWRAIRSGKLEDAAKLVNPLDFRVVQYTDDPSGHNMVLLEERRSGDGTWPRGWGMYAWSPEGTPSITVESPHPWDDEHTDSMAVQLFRETNAGTLTIAGASRDTLPSNGSDMAHVAGSIFDTVHREQATKGSTVIQLHGFNEAKYPNYGHAIFSEGVAPASVAPTVADSMRKSGFDVRVFDGEHYRPLGATTNLQGQSTRANGGHFLHIESSRYIRYEKPVRERYVTALSKAVQTFDAQQRGLAQTPPATR